ncbi:MAG TPA: tetratricopeptide repeat protein [Ignavibacteriales bacterium]|nr:tetratricopeptide repeat protein [Ignavibacteriales bacterium]
MKNSLAIGFVLALFLIGCQSKSDQDYFDSAVESWKEGKYEEAIASYNKLVEEYPDSKIAPSALFETGKLYQSRIIKALPPKQNSMKAVEAYTKIFKDYPNSEEAPKALFMVGYIQANELFQYEEARKTLHSFLEKYPQHELKFSAEIELENIGKSPEEIFRNNSEKM